MTIQWTAKYDSSVPQMIYPYTEPMTSARKDNNPHPPTPTHQITMQRLRRKVWLWVKPQLTPQMK